MLVAFEGIDGSGKSSVVRKVASALRRDGHTVKTTQEPTKTWLGRAVRKGISRRLEPLSLAFLFLSDRALHVKQLTQPDAIILTDRYRDSTTAYQAAALANRLPNALEYFQGLQESLFPAPDLALLLDIPAELGVERIKGRAHKEPFEKIAFLRRVRSNYLRLAKNGRLLVVDASPSLDIVVDKVLRVVRTRLDAR